MVKGEKMTTLSGSVGVVAQVYPNETAEESRAVAEESGRRACLVRTSLRKRLAKKSGPYPVRGEQVGSHYLSRAHRFFVEIGAWCWCDDGSESG